MRRFDLLDKIWGRVKTEDEQEDQIIEGLMRMAHNVLGAMAVITAAAR